MKVGERYKNYKEICMVLGEKECSGKSKRLQLLRWQESFKFHKEGYSYVIDEVYGTQVKAAAGGNRKHVDVFLPYVICCLYRSGIKDEYVGTQRMLKSELGLITPEVYNVFNGRSRDHTDYLHKNGVALYDSFVTFVHYFEMYAKETLERCLNVLSREGAVEWSPGQIFLVGLSHRRRVYTTGFEGTLFRVEEAVCNEMNRDRPDLIGRQYLHVIKRNKELCETFYKECVSRLQEETELMRVIGEKYKKKYKRTFTPEMLINYYRVYYIESINKTRLRKFKVRPIDSVRMKKALVNSEGPEMQTLKENVYNDIFQRMGKKNKMGIPDEEFEKMKFLIRKGRRKLNNKNYNSKDQLPQGAKSDKPENGLSYTVTN